MRSEGITGVCSWPETVQGLFKWLTSDFSFPIRGSNITEIIFADLQLFKPRLLYVPSSLRASFQKNILDKKVFGIELFSVSFASCLADVLNVFVNQNW